MLMWLDVADVDVDVDVGSPTGNLPQFWQNSMKFSAKNSKILKKISRIFAKMQQNLRNGAKICKF